MDELIRSHITLLALESFSVEHGESEAPLPTGLAIASPGGSVQLLSLYTKASRLLGVHAFSGLPSCPGGSIQHVLIDEAK